MESEYLKSTVGDALAEALKEVVEVRPADPVAFIAHQIMKWKKNFDRRVEMLEEAEELMRLMRELRGPSIVEGGNEGEGEGEEEENSEDEEIGEAA